MKLIELAVLSYSHHRMPDQIATFNPIAKVSFVPILLLSDHLSFVCATLSPTLGLVRTIELRNYCFTLSVLQNNTISIFFDILLLSLSAISKLECLKIIYLSSEGASY